MLNTRTKGSNTKEQNTKLVSDNCQSEVSMVVYIYKVDLDSSALLLNTLPYLMKAQFTFQISLDISNSGALSIENTRIYDRKVNASIKY